MDINLCARSRGGAVYRRGHLTRAARALSSRLRPSATTLRRCVRSRRADLRAGGCEDEPTDRMPRAERRCWTSSTQLTLPPRLWRPFASIARRPRRSRGHVGVVDPCSARDSSRILSRALPRPPPPTIDGQRRRRGLDLARRLALASLEGRGGVARGRTAQVGMHRSSETISWSSSAGRTRFDAGRRSNSTGEKHVFWS